MSEPSTNTNASSPLEPDAQSPKSPGTSERFPDSPTSDLILKSQDDTLFYVHIRNLSVHSSVFADAHDCVTTGASSSMSEPTDTGPGRETVEMTETASTLELLLQFIYPQRQPELADLAFDDLSSLAEAAEKWKVYAATSICNVYMTRFTKAHPLEVLRYATIHGYDALARDAAKHTVYLSTSEAVGILPTDIFVRWALYRDKMDPPQNPTGPGRQWITPPYIPNEMHNTNFSPCQRWPPFQQDILAYFRPGVLKIDFAVLFNNWRGSLAGCETCRTRYQKWEELYRNSGALPHDSTSLESRKAHVVF